MDISQNINDTMEEPVELTFEEEFPEYEFDEETKNLFMKDIDISYDMGKKETKKIKNKKTQQKPTVNLDKIIMDKENKSTKWKSSRAGEKKITTNTEEKKRHFNPRLPPFRTLLKDEVKVTALDFNNTTDYPQLS